MTFRQALIRRLSFGNKRIDAIRGAAKGAKGAVAPPKFWTTITEPLSKIFMNARNQLFVRVGNVGHHKLIFWLRAGRAGLKPMQPMRLHWAPRLREPRAMVFGQVVYFCKIILVHENCKKAYKSHFNK